jgi:hypothetical protein
MAGEWEDAPESKSKDWEDAPSKRTNEQINTDYDPGVGALLGAGVGLGAKTTGKLYNKFLSGAPSTVEVSAAPVSFKKAQPLPEGFAFIKDYHPGAQTNAYFNEQQRLANAELEKYSSFLNEKAAFEKANPGRTITASGINIPKEVSNVSKVGAVAPNIAEMGKMQAAFEGIKGMTAPIMQKASQVGQFLGTGIPGKIMSVANPMLALAGTGAGYNDMQRRMEHGDTIRGIISGLGSLGSAATMVPHPVIKGIGAAAAIGAPLANMAIDQLYGREGYAQGGLVYLAEGGSAESEEARRQLREWLEKNKPTAPRTYTERLIDMGRDPSIPGSPIVKNTPPSKGASGGAGFTPGAMNPFNPDSPLNRATGGDVKKPDASSIAGIESNITPQERAIVDYHRNTIASGNVGRDDRGYPVTVYSSTVDIPSGPYAGKVATVPGYYDRQIHNNPMEIYNKWADEINQGKWPIYYDPRTGDTRAKYIHGIMDAESDKIK